MNNIKPFKQGVDGVKCDYCGKMDERKTVTFIIGAAKSNTPEMFVMVEGTGKMACPQCYATAKAEAQTKKVNAIDTYAARLARIKARNANSHARRFPSERDRAFRDELAEQAAKDRRRGIE